MGGLRKAGVLQAGRLANHSLKKAQNMGRLPSNWDPGGKAGMPDPGTLLGDACSTLITSIPAGRCHLDRCCSAVAMQTSRAPNRSNRELRGEVNPMLWPWVAFDDVLSESAATEIVLMKNRV